ncbi:hypothetical protein [Tychonema sp. BBK16]|uniref:hypothetical protein n=1 Tax=Tychonema sp. BBK16 TaxID=2699888 RepID=UPI001F327781|nr:hypothetical protein [Tychonema sp. BBK16]MCF6373087.1 hypothetical protein [Tychonema sp. BBK16]
MSKIIYDVIQRFEVEKGVPRLISTNIQVIQGGEDLMSSAANLLKQLGFYDKFEENRTSQYIGYRLKNPRKGDKRYQLVLAQRKEGLCISIPQDILEPYLLNMTSHVLIPEQLVIGSCLKASYWILPSKRDNFLNSIKGDYWHLFDKFNIGDESEIKGDFYLNHCEDDGWGMGTIFPSKLLDEFQADSLSNDPQSYLRVDTAKLFPYAWQVSVSSNEILEEFLGHFAKIIMEAQ